MISALAKSTWCICQALSKGFLLLLVFPWQALPKGLLHVHSIPNNGVLVLLATPWQALSKGLLHVQRMCVVSPWQALPKGLHVHSFNCVSPRLALPKGMLEVPDEISQKICCSWAVPGWFQLIVLLILLLIFHVFGETFSIDFHALETDVFYWLDLHTESIFVIDFMAIF